jgi:hypothetical protein
VDISELLINRARRTHVEHKSACRDRPRRVPADDVGGGSPWKLASIALLAGAAKPSVLL